MHAQSLNRVQPFATPWNGTHQAHLSMGFSRQEYWGGWPFPSPVYPQVGVHGGRAHISGHRGAWNKPSLPPPAPQSPAGTRPAGGSACIPLSTRRPSGKSAPAPAPHQTKNLEPTCPRAVPKSPFSEDPGRERGPSPTPGGLRLPARKAVVFNISNSHMSSMC